MGIVEHTENETLASIPIGRRISELMQERGDAYSIRAFAERIGLNRETLRLMLNGERRISPSELNKIANGLRITVDRLTQTDTHWQEQELAKLLKSPNRTKSVLQRAQAFAEDLVKLATGASEKGNAMINLGRVQYLQQQYEEAHQTFLQALEFARISKEQYDDDQLFFLVSGNLMLTYTLCRDFSNMEALLSLVESAFPENPYALGKTYYTRMVMEKERGHFEAAKKHAYRSLEHFEQTNDEKLIGKALINVAHYESHFGNFNVSARALTSAIKMLQHDDANLVIAIKEYIKALMKLGKMEAAARVVEEQDSFLRNYPEYWGKLQVMYSILKDDPLYAENISNDSSMNHQVRYFACKYLFDFYAKKGDAETALNYYKKGKIYAKKSGEFYEEEEF